MYNSLSLRWGTPVVYALNYTVMRPCPLVVLTIFLFVCRHRHINPTLYHRHASLQFTFFPFIRLKSLCASLTALKALQVALTLFSIRMAGMTIQNAFMRTKYPQ